MIGKIINMEDCYFIAALNKEEVIESNVKYVDTAFCENVIASTCNENLASIVIVLNNTLVHRADIGEKSYLDLLNKIYLRGLLTISIHYDMVIIDFDNPNRKFTLSEVNKIIIGSINEHLWTKHPGLMVERKVLDFVHNDIIMRFSAKQVLKFIIYCLAGLALIQLLS